MLVKSIPIADIKVENRRREEFGDIEGLAESIRKYGLFNPVTVDDKNNLIAGERRLRACRLLEWSEIPVRLYRDLTDDERQEMELEENFWRKDLTPYERSKNLVKLVEVAATVAAAGFSPNAGKNPKGGRPQKANSESKIAERIGVPQQTINVAKQHVSAVNKYPELSAPGIPQKDAITIAKTLDAMPEQERTEARSRFLAGDSNTKAALAGKPPLPPPLKREVTPADRWNKAVADLRHRLYGLRQFGGVAKLAERWTPEQVKDFKGELIEFRAELDSYVHELEAR